MRLWRIGRAAHPAWSGEGARLYGARWNPRGLPAIYTGCSYAIAALESLVHANLGMLAANLVFVVADLPAAAIVERVDPGGLPGWNDEGAAVAQAFGRAWLMERRSLVLLVPSVVTQGLDWNAVVNPLHPDFGAIAVTEPQPVAWDGRLRIGG